MLLSGIAFVVLLALLAIGIPVATSFMLVALLGIVILKDWNMALSSLGIHYVEFLSRYIFSAMPLFFLMGQFGYFSGLMEGLFEAGRAWLGRLRAGLALTVVAVCAAYAACTTLAVASVLIIGRAAIPPMRKVGYSDAMATGVVGGSSTLANLIPPTTIIIMYGILTDASIANLLVAAWIPGFVSAAFVALITFIWARKVPIDQAKYTWKQKFYSIRYLSVIVITVIALMGGLYYGWATPTEAGAIGAFVTFLVAVIARKMSWKVYLESIKSACFNVGSLLIIIASGAFFSNFLAIAGFNTGIQDFIASLHAPPIIVFLVFSLILLALGCVIDVSSMMVITLPLMFPVIVRIGYNPIWFGIVYVLFCQIAALTPPYAVVLFALKSICPDIDMKDIIRGNLVFVFAYAAIIVIFYMFPQIVLWLPSKMVGG